VIVGDPLQLEPVVTVPFRAQQALRIDHGVAERWLPERCSVQTLADALMPVGTSLPDGTDEPRWVGAPLRVHRRCDEPMFGIVNRVVYDVLMVFGVPPSRGGPTLGSSNRPLPATKWLDVPSRQSEGNWVPAEGERLAEVLDYLARHGQEMEQVMVLSPFRAVAAGVRRIARRYPGVRAGTVHTAQGKEADIVFLVLGSDPARPGKRRDGTGGAR
jgi:Superfamily I DNA and RNA helicases and helicase subunits